MRKLVVVATTLVALIVSAAVPTSAWAEEASPVASPGAAIVESAVAVDGRSLHVACVGSGGPTVLLEGGGPATDGSTYFVYALGSDLAAAFGTRVCAYDRAGTGQSDPDPKGVRTLKEAAADFLAVMASPDLGCPCVAVGGSLGGSIALMALNSDPSESAGLVLLDAVYPGYLDEFIALGSPGSPEAALASDPYMTGQNEEKLDLVTGFRQVAAPARPPGIPVVVVTHGAGEVPGCFPCSAGYPVEKMEAAWQAGQVRLAAALGAKLVVAENTGHDIATENPGLAIAVTAEVIAAVHDPSTWATPAASPAA
jgi:pimeloyl-ACP methyl ester carboxylesterase